MNTFIKMTSRIESKSLYFFLLVLFLWWLLFFSYQIDLPIDTFFTASRHKKQKEEDISICECKFDFGDPDSACGERCLNVITNTECTPGYCPCGVYCKNQVIRSKWLLWRFVIFLEARIGNSCRRSIELSELSVCYWMYITCFAGYRSIKNVNTPRQSWLSLKVVGGG